MRLSTETGEDQGHMAKVLSAEVLANTAAYFHGHALKVTPHLTVLADETAGEEAWIKAIFAIIKVIAPK